MIEDFDIRYTKMEDEKYLIKWLEDKNTIKYFPMSLDEVEPSAKNWVGFCRYNCSLTAVTKDGLPIGMVTLFLMPYKKIAHLAMFYIVVDPTRRRNGIGTSLMQNVLNLARNYFYLDAIYAEVFLDSPIVSILKKMNFEEMATQEKFFKNIDGSYNSRVLLQYTFETSVFEVKSIK